MSKKTDLTTDHRRRLVARMVGRGAEAHLGLHGIAQKLADPEQPEELRSTSPSGEPWSVATISRDVAHVKELWRNESLRSMVEQRAIQLARLNELLLTALGKPGPAWAAEARQLLSLQARLLGTDTDTARLHELLSQQLHLAMGRLEAAFADRPALLREIITALVGGEEQLVVQALPEGTAAEA